MLTYDLINKNKRESWLLISIFLVIIIAIGWTFSMAYEAPEILYFAVGFSVLSSLISYYFSDSITLGISRAVEVDRAANQQLYNVVENLCIAAGLPTPRIYIIDDTAPNAFATGRDPKHAVVCVTTGILQKLDKTELEGVISHELSHNDFGCGLSRYYYFIGRRDAAGRFSYARRQKRQSSPGRFYNFRINLSYFIAAYCYFN